jgi:hypothetical protein
MSEQAGAGTQRSKKRSVGFPQLSLGESVDAVIAIGQHGASHTQDAAAAYMGHSTANSGAFRTKCASLRDFGLIVRGDRERVVLSDLAEQLVLEAPGDQKFRHLLLTAFETCRVFGMLYNDSAKDIPQDLQRFRANVVMRYGVASDQADKFLNSFVDSLVYAGLGQFDGNRVTLFTRDTVFKTDDSSDDEDDEEPALISRTVQRDASLSGARVHDLQHEPSIPVALRQAWPIEGGEIEFVIRTPKAMPSAIYALMAKMAEVAAEMEALLRPEPVAGPVSNFGTLSLRMPDSSDGN